MNIFPLTELQILKQNGYFLERQVLCQLTFASLKKKFLLVPPQSQFLPLRWHGIFCSRVGGERKRKYALDFFASVCSSQFKILQDFTFGNLRK